MYPQLNVMGQLWIGSKNCYRLFLQHNLKGTIMDIKRRDFFGNMGKTASVVVAGVVAPTLLHLNSVNDEFKTFCMDMNGKLGSVTDEVKEQLNSLSNRLDGTALKLSYHQVQLYFIFLLLVLSFGIDAGMTAVWFL